MLRLQAFGGLSLLRDGELVSGAGARRRPLALLAILAAAGGRGVSRAKLTGWLWPESDDAKARNVLSQTLYAMRRDLGEDLLLEATELRLNAACIETDVVDFLNAVDRDDSDAVVAVYAGPFLDGFYLNDAPEFERWAEEQRAAFEQRAIRALESLAVEAGRSGDVVRATAHWQRLAALAPLSSRVATGLMEALAAAGDSAGALQAARIHEALVREELGAEPDNSVRALADRLRRGGAVAHPAVGRVATELVATEKVAGPSAPLASPVAALSGTPVPVRVGTRRRAMIGAGVAVMLLAAAGAALLLRDSTAAVAPDADAVAVFPFRVAGADPSLAYLREGMMDLLAAKLTAERDAHAADPRAVVAALQRAGTLSGLDALPRDEAVRLAARLGSGLALLGSVVGTPARVELNATLVRVPSGAARAVASVSGPADSLSALVDRLLVQLLATSAGEARQLASLTNTPLSTLRAYVDGQAAYRRGRYGDAVDDFGRVLDADSTFALAAVGLFAAGNWGAVSDPGPLQRGLRLAVAAREGLPLREKAALLAWIGPRYPAPARPAYSESVIGWEHAVQLAPDRAEYWYELGDALFHGGPLMGLDGAHERAVGAFSRAIELDSSFVPPLGHLLELAAKANDSVRVRTLSSAYLARDSSSDAADFLRWRVAVSLNDGAALKRLRARFDQMSTGSLERIVGAGQLDGIALDDVDDAAAVLKARAVTNSERWGVAATLHSLAINRGHFAAARAATVALTAAGGAPSISRRMLVLDALFGGGDSAAAQGALPALEAEASAVPAATAGALALQSGAICTMELWRLAHADLRSAAASITRLRANMPAAFDSVTVQMDNVLCAAVLEAQFLAARKHPRARSALVYADSLAQLGRTQFPMLSANEVNLVVGRLWEEQGDRAAALAAIRRRCYHWFLSSYLAVYLREEARLAAATGDRIGAERANRHYLALRGTADGSRPQGTPRPRTLRDHVFSNP